MSSTQDAAAEAAMAGAVNKMMASATAPKPAAKTTALKLTVDAADKTALSRTQTTALNRARAVLSPAFSVSVEYGGEEAEQSADDEKTEPASGAAPV